ncbi:RHS repeat-associated core domain-containing protein [Lysobacter firmicutimachus]|uniref:RHS repeat-associated core domain-containing protein n=1 Tax=Lysobacter firmicutimachus TaxID=1792846 RepID=A0ABU8D099_9GAMM
MPPIEGSSPLSVPPRGAVPRTWLTGLLLTAAALSAGGTAQAQEAGKQWTSTWTSNGPRLTEREIQQDIEALFAPYSSYGPLSFQVVSQVHLPDRTAYYYGIEPMPPTTEPWSYTHSTDPDYIPGPTLEGVVDQLRQHLDQRSLDEGCTPNTAITLAPAWDVSLTWVDDKTSAVETRAYDANYVIKDADGVCGFIANDSQYLERTRDVHCPNTVAMGWDAAEQACAGSLQPMAYLSPPLVPDCPDGGCDPASGDKMRPEPDFDLGWVSFTRIYRSSSSSQQGGFGLGWTHSHNLRLSIGADPAAPSDPTQHFGLIQADGSQISFKPLGAGVYEARDGSGDRLVADGSQWLLYRVEEVLRFDARGRLIVRRFEDGNTLAYAYDDLGRLATITHHSGRSLVFEYLGAGRNAPIAAIRSAGALLASYGYTNGTVSSATYAGGGARTYHYEHPQFKTMLTGVTGEDNQRQSTFGYDAKARVGSSQNAGGADGRTLSYPASGGAVITDALGKQTTYALGPASPSNQPRKIGAITDPRGTVTRTFYTETVDFRRRLDTVTDRNGTQTKHSYAEANDPVTGQPARTHTVKEAVGLPQERTSLERRDIAANRTVLTQLGNRETRIVRNARLQPVTVTVRDTTTNQTRTTAYAYCEAADVAAANSSCPTLGLLKSVDGPRSDVNDVVTYQYYGSDDSTCATQPALCTYRKGDLRKTIDALGRATEILGYDPQGRPLSILDANGVVTDYEYHPRGWLAATKLRGADNSVETDDRITRMEYWPTGLLRRVTPPGGAYVTYNYDAAQRLTSVTDKAGNKLQYTLDKAGNRKQEDTQTPTGTVRQTLSRVFDSLGQLHQAKDAAAHATTFTYDADGNPDLTTDALGRISDQNHDPLNRLSRLLQDVNGLAVETQLAYNAFDQVTQVTDPKGLNTVYAYNGFGDRTQLSSPDTGVTDYTYTPAGQLATKKDANDAVAHSYTYDALGRPKTISYGSGTNDVEYDYDTVNAVCAAGETFALGRLTALRTEGTELKYCYDRYGQLVRKVQVVDSKSFTLRYAYTTSGQVRTITYPDNAVVDYVRNTLDQVTEVGVKPAGGVRTVLLNGVAYEPFGPATGWTYGNGRSLARSYDLDYRAKTIHDNAAGGLSLGYGYNEVGELTELKDGLQSAVLAKYDYDTLGRLKITRDGPSNTPIETYSYDATGNRTSLLHAGTTTTYTYPTTSHRLTQVGGIARGYNAVGNTTSIGGTAKEFVYNGNDRMSQVKLAGVVNRSYRYNAKGERVAATNGASGPVAVYTLYDEAGHWLGDYDANGATQQQAVWLGDAPVGVLAGAGTAQKLHYVQPDHLGTPRTVIDATRNVAIWSWNAKGEAFGNDAPNQDPDQDGTAFVFDLRFPGQRYDAATGLNYNYFRDYDAASGRYVQSDPIGLRGGLGTYVYAYGSPGKYKDEDGRIVRLSGGAKDMGEFISLAEKFTGLKISRGSNGILATNQCAVIGVSTSFPGAASALLAAINSSAIISITATSNDPRVQIDQYYTGLVDVADISGFAGRSNALGASAFAHVLAEYRYAMEAGGNYRANFNNAHGAGLRAETAIMGGGYKIRLRYIFSWWNAWY